MDSTDLQYLEDLTKKASKGPWHLLDEGDLIEVQNDQGGVVGEVFDSSQDPRRQQALSDLEYISTADPQTVMAMISMIRSLQQDRDALAAHLQSIKTARRSLSARTIERGLAEAIDGSPSPDLKRRDMEMEADILYRIAEDVENAGTAQRLVERAEALREQVRNLA